MPTHGRGPRGQYQWEEKEETGTRWGDEGDRRRKEMDGTREVGGHRTASAVVDRDETQDGWHGGGVQAASVG